MLIKYNLISIIFIFVSLGSVSKSNGNFRTSKIARYQQQQQQPLLGFVSRNRSQNTFLTSHWSQNNNNFPDSIENQFSSTIVESGRGRGRRPKRRQNLLQRILPMFLVPFLVQSAILPIILSGMKFMLLKSLTIGKIALILMLINIVRRNDYSDSEIKHYGYSGNEEYGAYVN